MNIYYIRSKDNSNVYVNVFIAMSIDEAIDNFENRFPERKITQTIDLGLYNRMKLKQKLYKEEIGKL